MKAVTIPRYGSPDVLEIRDYPNPETGVDEIKIKVKAAGINFADILARKGLYPDAPSAPVVVGYEVAGEVLEAGRDAGDFKPGDRVTALTRFGGYANRVVVKHNQVFPTPDNLSDIEAAAIPVNYLTAWQLVEMSGLTRHDTLLIHNAGGGVGLAVIDLAVKKGARILGTASSAKHDRLRARGLDICIDYRKEDWVQKVLEHTGGKGADVIFDPLGGAYWKKNYQVLRKTGRLGMFGISEVTESALPGVLRFIPMLRKLPFYSPIKLMNDNKGVFGVNVGKLWREQDKVSMWAKEILKGAAEGWVNPHVDAAFTFEEAEEAHRYIENRRNFGKVVLLPDG